jgi:hypothetical protein
VENVIIKKLSIINRYMRNKKISYDLQQKIRQYLEYLSSRLQEELQYEANRIVLTESPIFSHNFSVKFRTRCVAIIREVLI